jgi:hypothetical protein
MEAGWDRLDRLSDLRGECRTFIGEVWEAANG